VLGGSQTREEEEEEELNTEQGTSINE